MRYTELYVNIYLNPSLDQLSSPFLSPSHFAMGFVADVPAHDHYSPGTASPTEAAHPPSCFVPLHGVRTALWAALNICYCPETSCSYERFKVPSPSSEDLPFHLWSCIVRIFSALQSKPLTFPALSLPLFQAVVSDTSPSLSRVADELEAQKHMTEGGTPWAKTPLHSPEQAVF